MYTSTNENGEKQWISLDRRAVVETPKHMLEQMTFLMAIQADAMVGRASSHQEVIANANCASEFSRIARLAAALADDLANAYHTMSECYVGYFSPEECGEDVEETNGTEVFPPEVDHP